MAGNVLYSATVAANVESEHTFGGMAALQVKFSNLNKAGLLAALDNLREQINNDDWPPLGNSHG